MAQEKTLNISAVREAYRRWAPVYDSTFGLIANAGRREAVHLINQRRGGRVLEVGVGTGLSLPHYAPYLKVSGVDISPEMLAKARDRVRKHDLRNVEGLREMDAASLDFSENAFDIVVAMYVMTVVPNPERVMQELERVCAPGGEVMIVNHFSQDHGARGWVERKMSPYADSLGWHPIFPIERVMGRPGLALIERRPLWPSGLFTLVRFRRLKAAA